MATGKFSALGKLHAVVVAGVLVASIEGCASKQVVEEKTSDAKMTTVEQKTEVAQLPAAPALPGVVVPEWTAKGNGAFQDAGKNVFYGVGIVSGVSNKALAISAADERARVGISEAIKTYMALLHKDYQASIGSGKEENGEQNIERTFKTFSSTTLNGAMIVDHWTDPTDGSIYALAKMDLGSVKSSFPWLKGIGADARDYYMKNAERAFAELATEEQKANGQGKQEGQPAQ